MFFIFVFIVESFIKELKYLFELFSWVLHQNFLLAPFSSSKPNFDILTCILENVVSFLLTLAWLMLGSFFVVSTFSLFLIYFYLFWVLLMKAIVTRLLIGGLRFIQIIFMLRCGTFIPVKRILIPCTEFILIQMKNCLACLQWVAS